MDLLEQLSIRQLNKEEAIPWELLLDADPSVDAIAKYLEASDIYIALLSEEIVGTFVLCPIDAQQ